MTDTALMNVWAWSLQVGALTVAAALVACLVQIDVPAARYGWWRVVLLVCLALPVIQPWHPRHLPTSEIVAPGETAASLTDLSVSVNRIEPGTTGTQVTPVPWASIVVGVLAAGAVLRLGWLMGGLIRLRRVRHTGQPADASDAPELLQALVATGADVRYVESLRQPVTFGLRPAVVLLPASLRTLSAGVQQAVLAHELWHVRRRDWLWSFFEEVLCSIFWFHPAIWYLVTQVQGAREEVVDRLSVLSTNARRAYLEALLVFAEEPALQAAAPFIRRRQLFNRMLLISKEDVMSPKRTVASSVVMAAVLIAAGWYGTLAFPLTGTDAVTVPRELRSQQAQPRDPRPGVARPETVREQELKTATSQDPSNVNNWLELAKLQEQRGALAEAESTLASAVNATGGKRDVLLSQARFYTRHGNFTRAIELLESVAAQDPTDPAGHHLVATYYWEKAQRDTTLTPAEKLMYIDGGIRASDRALAQRSDYVEALVYKNILLRLKGNLETDPARREQLFSEADLLRGRAMELRKQNPPAPASIDPNAPPPPPPPPPPPGNFDVDGQQAVRIGGDIPAPKKIHDVRPVYPPEARDARVHGTVIIQAVIDTQGDVRSAQVLRSIPTLDAAALEAVKQWRFTPTVLDGVAVPVVMTLTVNFTLE